jgi:hypothetical protein
MAKNWTAREAIKAIREGNKEAMLDIGKRFPLFAMACVPGNEAVGLVGLVEALPEYLTARKLDTYLKGGKVEEGDEDTAEDIDDTDDEETAAPAKKAVAKEEPKTAAKGKFEIPEGFKAMTAKEIYALCKKNKIEIKENLRGDKRILVKALLKAGIEPPEVDEDTDDEDEVKEEPKAKAATKKAAKAAVVEDDDEDEEPAPKKSTKKKVVEEDDDDEEPAPKKASKKAAKKVEDEDDDWDI